jgi:hypothetical protein
MYLGIVEQTRQLHQRQELIVAVDRRGARLLGLLYSARCFSRCHRHHHRHGHHRHGHRHRAWQQQPDTWHGGARQEQLTASDEGACLLIATTFRASLPRRFASLSKSGMTLLTLRTIAVRRVTIVACVTHQLRYRSLVTASASDQLAARSFSTTTTASTTCTTDSTNQSVARLAIDRARFESLMRSRFFYAPSYSIYSGTHALTRAQRD